ncbi:MAG: UPF0489 family protein [Candidatus Gracilibacteria bacterium]|nr:UPF0489 family protein [Candidatus Gracilibacteria bacterium]
MFYKKGFYIEKPVGNNAFSFEKRQNKKLYVPEIIDLDINDLDNIQVQNDVDKIAFEDFGFDDNLSTNYGLKNFYRIRIKGKEIILFDNHNHAFYFWYEARNRSIIGDNNLLIHIDEHADTRDNNKYLLKPDSFDLEKVFNFTNEVLNVGDYIIPAKVEGLIGEVIQIRNTSNLEEYLKKYFDNSKLDFWGDYKVILNLDLDFFQPDLDFIDYDLKKKVVRDAFKKADFITISTSPFFINQELAINVFKDLFRDL